MRRHQPGQSSFVRGQFGDWDLDTPRIGGSFSSLLGWVRNSGGANRCSGYSLPPVVSSSTSFGSIVGFSATDYWRGTFIHVPGQSGQEVLRRALGFADAPADGFGYPLVTHRNWQIRCLDSLRNGGGEGFLAVSPDGVRYRFDWMATRAQTQVGKSGASIGRTDVFLMATEVTERFGNWVRYTYDAANPLLMTRIEPNDGRVVTVTNSGGRAVAASHGTRTYAYAYTAQANLSRVTRPDGSRWTFDLAPMVPVDLATAGEGANCDQPGGYPGEVLTGTITHPSGATGRFTTEFQLLGRTGVDRVCHFAPNSTTVAVGARWPRWVSSQVLKLKRLSGPGLAPLERRYGSSDPGGWSNCPPRPPAWTACAP